MRCLRMKSGISNGGKCCDQEGCKTMKAIVVMNGQFYAGENTQDNTLVFNPDRSKAVEVDERRLRYITQTVLRWSMDKVIELQRLEILKIGGGKKC